MLLQKSVLRLIAGCALVTTACVIGMWDYSSQQYHAWQHSHDREESFSNLPTEPEFLDETLEIKSGDNFSTVLRRARVSRNQASSVIEALKTKFNPRDLRTDHAIFITYKPQVIGSTTTKDLTRLVIKLSLEKEVIVERNDTGSFDAQLEQKQLVHEYREAKGAIQNSLYVDAVKQGAHPKILQQMIQAFSYDVDFQRSFHQGDEYQLVFDYHKEPDSLQERPGDLLFACLTLQGKRMKIYRYTPRKGIPQYFTEKGESVKKGLLRTPIDGARISSGYGRRKHPVLGFTKMHKGVDFAAPRGTPIMAAGSGKITRIGRLGSYGNYIRIRHNKKYSTAYAHMSRFARGLKVGSSVRQGQVIGYVGRTGRVTGVHLHYELLADGKQVNPKHVKMLPRGKLRGRELKRFLLAKAGIDQKLIALQNAPTNSLIMPAQTVTPPVTVTAASTPSKKTIIPTQKPLIKQRA